MLSTFQKDFRLHFKFHVSLGCQSPGDGAIKLGTQVTGAPGLGTQPSLVLSLTPICGSWSLPRLNGTLPVLGACLSPRLSRL